MSDSVRPHGLQPIRLLHPWDSPGKNTGVGCHFLLQCMKVKSKSEVAQLCPTLNDPMDCSLLGFFQARVHAIFQARVLEWVATAFSYHWLYMAVKGIRRKEARISREPGFCGEGRRKEKWLTTGQGEYNGRYFFFHSFSKLLVALYSSLTNKQKL